MSDALSMRTGMQNQLDILHRPQPDTIWPADQRRDISQQQLVVLEAGLAETVHNVLQNVAEIVGEAQ